MMRHALPAAGLAGASLLVLVLASGLGGALPIVHDDVQVLTGVLIGGAWLVAGLVAWRRRPENRTGRLMTAVALAYLALPALAVTGQFGAAVAVSFANVWLAVAVHLFLAFPSGRLASRPERVATAAAYAAALVVYPVGWLFRGPSDVECPGCTRNPLQIADDPRTVEIVFTVTDALTLLVVAAIVVILIRRWRSATPPGRRVLAPVLWTSLAAVVLFFVSAAATEPGDEPPIVSVFAAAAFFAIPLGFLAGLLRTRRHLSVVADLVVALGAAPAPARVRDALARALGDPSLELVYWLPDSRRYVDLDGRTVDPPVPGPERAVLALQRGEEPLAAVSYDPVLLDDDKLVEACAAAVRLAVENARLHADLRAQLREVRASRARIVAAGDTERRRIERNLHDGAQQRLLGVRLALKLARGQPGDEAEVHAMLTEIDEEVAGAIDDLRDLARGVHPAVLVDQGLRPALASLARRAPVRVEIAAVPAERLPLPVETAAYYLAAEGLANVAKHAGATRVRIAVAVGDGRAVIELADDGVGGADDEAGSGLRGLRDRIEALDGSLDVDSAPGSGTRLRAMIPCE